MAVQPTMRLLPTVDDIARAIAQVTDPGNTPAWDPVGVQLGDPGAPVGSIAVCHEVTDPVLRAIEEKPVDLLVTYHPLLFDPVNRLTAGESAGGRAFRIIAAGAALLVTHTDFDASPGGSADSLAALFDLRAVSGFGGDPDLGWPAIGRVGTFDRDLAAVDAIASDAFGTGGLRVSGDPKAHVERLAVIPGSGGSMVEAAAAVADALVTGDVSHHRVVAARDLGLAIVDPGHIATERPGMAALVEMVAGAAGMEVVDLTGIDPQTWR